MITCADLEELVADDLEGRLPERERRELERHLAECGACQEFVAAYSRTVWIARTTISGSSRPAPAPETLVQSILGALRR